MIIKEALREAASSLKEAGITEPFLEGEVLLSHAIEWDRAKIYAHDREVIPRKLEKTFQAYLARRVKREPLPYILGYKEFYGLEFFVDSRVLIPRPETELLVEEAIEYALHLRELGKAVINIVDVGTGSGVIGVCLANLLGFARVWCIDISPKAIEVASMNVKRHDVEDKITLLRGDLLDVFPGSVDIVVANLPYIRHEDLRQLQPEIARFEPSLALDGGSDGKSSLIRLMIQANEKLNRPGLLLAEIGEGQASELLDSAEELLPGALLAIHKDLAGLDRILRAEL